MRTTFDLAPLHRFTVGFDQLGRVLDAVTRLDEGSVSYPPYNIEKQGEDAYRITMAVAGFAEDDLDIMLKERTLVITGRKAEGDEERSTFLHRGIATRAFERKFELAAHIEVVGASVDHGLLHVDLKREVPEALKPRQIAISRVTPGSKVIEQSTDKAH